MLVADMSTKFRSPPHVTEKLVSADTFTKNRCFFQLCLDAYQNGLKHNDFVQSQLCNKISSYSE